MNQLVVENLKDVQAVLKSDVDRVKLISHPAFKRFKDEALSKEQVTTILGQWYFPLHNFPYFLSASIAHIHVGAIQTFISDILHEELGCGDPSQSHLDLYFSTIADAGIDVEKVAGAQAFASTKALVEGYKQAAKNQNQALGFLYATEVADLAMVSSIGAALANYCNRKVKDLPWVNIHIQQEPNHVNKVDDSLNVKLSQDDFYEIWSSAKTMWQLWVDFFDEIERNLN